MPLNPLSLITSRLAGPVLLVLVLILGVLSVSQCSGRQSAEREANRLRLSIDAPRTGWRDRLAACHRNEATLEGALVDQAAKVREWKAQGDLALAAADSAAELAKRGQLAAEARARRLLNVPTTGRGACADLEAVDAELLSTLKTEATR